MFLAGTCGVHWAHGQNNVISVDFSVIIGFFIQKNMGLETKILSLSILDVE